jgi:hypothetical protein
MALGATRRGVIGLIEGVELASAGMAFGLIDAYFVDRCTY